MRGCICGIIIYIEHMLNRKGIMAQKTKRATIIKKTTSKKQKKNWAQSFWSRTWAKPAAIAVVFAIIGVGSFVWVNAATTTYSLWSSSVVPRTITVADTGNIELGVKFQSDVAGRVTGVRFYKGSQNSGTHIGTLWDSAGNRLASVTFTNETRSGWQSASFARPISIAANIPYVISYHAPVGRYSLNTHYFIRALQRGHLTAFKSSPVAGDGNGVYKYGSTTVFPDQNSDGKNYWVDVIFTNKLINPIPAPAAPTGVQAMQSGVTANVSWTASTSSKPIASYTVVRDGVAIATVTGTTYNDSGVKYGATYNYQVKATDTMGATSALSIPASVTMVAPTGGGTTPPPVTSANFTFKGPQIIDPQGKPFIPIGSNVNGPNFVWQGATLGQSGIAASTWHWNTVRVNACFSQGCENGGGYHFNNNNDLTSIVNEYTAKHIVVIIDLQQYNPGTYPNVADAITWWKGTASQYKNNPYVWFNLLNEPGADPSTLAQWNNVTAQIADVIRGLGISNVIVADGSSYGQEAGDWTCNLVNPANSGILTYGPQLEKTYGPIVFSMHAYSMWGGGSQGCSSSQLDARLGNYIDMVQAKGLPLILGETGSEPTAAENQSWEVGQIPATQTVFRVVPGKGVGVLPWHGDVGAGYVLVNNASWTSAKSDGSNLSWIGQDLWNYAHKINQ